MPIKSILVVDDSPTDRQHLSELLSKSGYKVPLAESAEDALAKVKQLRPDLVLMDVVMPGQNGFQATRTLTKDEATKHIPVILCTSKSQETDRVWGMRQGARDYVVKPVSPADLLAKIRRSANGCAHIAAGLPARPCRAAARRAGRRHGRIQAGPAGRAGPLARRSRRRRRS